MGVFTATEESSRLSIPVLAASLVTLFVTWKLIVNGFKSKPGSGNEPPTVSYWFPFIGSAVTYGQDPIKFLNEQRKIYGDIFTFVMFGRRITAYLGTKGNDFILNGKIADSNPEEVYNVLTAPVWGRGVVYDIPHAKYMEQKRFIKFGLTSKALRSYVPLIQEEFHGYVGSAPAFQGKEGDVEILSAMSQIVIFTASRSLQGNEVRERLNSSFAENYHDLDMGFTPINFLFPGLPIPRNRKRDIAQKRMASVYLDIIRTRRENPHQEPSEDMIWNLMRCSYKDGSPLTDTEIAHLMIALLMAGQASSAVTSSWVMLRLAANPSIAKELYEEQVSVLGNTTSPLDLDDVQKLTLHAHVVRETLRMHPPVNTLMRKVKRPLEVPGSDLIIPESNILLAAIGHISRQNEHFADANTWDPHRWYALQSLADEEKSAPKIDYGYGLVNGKADSPFLPFGAGRHRCIGEQFTYLQLVSVVALMVREFEFMNPEGRKGVPPTDWSSMVARPTPTARIRWKRRSRNVEII